MKKVIIVIPVYKPMPSETELASLRQCLKVLSHHPIALMTYKELDLNAYMNEFLVSAVPFEVVFFDRDWFSRLRRYSQLLMRPIFYEAFQEYEFIQIYQLDAWVFRDDLDHWCDQGYSFIGAPLADREPFCVGNGGFSLRKVPDCLRVLCLGKELDQRVPYDSPRLHDSWSKLNWKGRCMAIVRWFGLCRSYRYFLERSTLDEDAFWGTMAALVDGQFGVPDVETAGAYSWDAQPTYFFQQRKGLLPMGCHAMEKWGPDLWRLLRDQDTSFSNGT